jgi:hypothetical protein
MIDRTGLAARFLRLAFRINKEQMALVSEEAPPRPEPLSEAEHGEQEADAAAARAAFKAVRDYQEADARAYEQQIRDAALAAGQAAERTESASQTPSATSSAEEEGGLNLHNLRL